MLDMRLVALLRACAVVKSGAGAPTITDEHIATILGAVALDDGACEALLSLVSTARALDPNVSLRTSHVTTTAIGLERALLATLAV